MGYLKFGIVGVAVLVAASFAFAGSWTTDSYSYSVTGFTYVGDAPNGQYVYGTWEYEITRAYKYEDGLYHHKFHERRSFVSSDGVITGHGVHNTVHRIQAGAAVTYTDIVNVVYTHKDQGILDKDQLIMHFTYNPDGRLVSYKYEWKQ
ncbi:MAG: hypothetical protein ACYTG3_21265 [Planctomycetota bacterium]|jgi:hypothetical protein